ncbi:hypothetical protein GCM10010922_03100 [Microbacterium sorbitolivorans]|uniref:Uncharacterized protein n=1 Tax=Microbacterium sorbitolivorans TaxID=1867410 RepID=A0A367Y7B3_9MICO|nr:hypothetical protein [Microbacterium sorbitolivorans]RCK61529.1 hypothetical protein DTO57_02520 [Microbacterium sorbitolivorans]GGF31436.1 hypothetical protein GCM10010922_03100 [Microbacterium sorbitolivorans]
MTTSTRTRIAAPDESESAAQLIQLGLAMDPEARSETLARLIAASLHDGPGTALYAFANGIGFNAQAMLDELNSLCVPLEQECWVDALGRHIFFNVKKGA